ncbi:MAG: hypothetical protein J6Q92_04880 [Oscillospiraceae bacterium]|nr:hypothetical protein [Oscillospiraceae bacterium]
MKKCIAMILALTLVMGLAACGKKEDNKVTNENAPKDALEILTNIWNGIPEDKRFYAMGGDAANPAENAPGNYSLTDEGLTATLLVPAQQIENIDQAASLMHGMMANHFTGAAFHMAEGKSAEDFTKALRETVVSNRWLCGMPEHFTIATIGGEYVLFYYGINNVIEPFVNSFKAAYPDAVINYDEAITE